jgi:hypothetical protein
MKNRPIVMCGFPRSGSTMAYLMLKGTVKNYSFFGKEQDCLKINKKYGWAAKRPMSFFDIPEIKNKFKPYFLINIRDPRAVLTSIHKHSEGQYKISADYSLKTSIINGVCGTTKGLLDYWHNFNLIPNNAIFIYYEELVLSPDEVQAKLKKMLPIECNGRFENFHKTKIPDKLTAPLNGIRAVDKTNIDKWKAHPERIRDQFTRFPELFDILIHLGYEKDNTWFENYK